jgi:hypothetical protein
MPAPKGHKRYNEAFRPKIFTVETLWNEFVDYIEWCAENPIIQQVSHVKNGVIDIEHKRPYSIEGFCNFVDINKQTFFNYAKAEGYETFFDICSRITQTIDNQHFEGGMVGIYNSNIVTRKLGLIEKSEQNIKGETALKVEVSNPETKAILDDLISENES